MFSFENLDVNFFFQETIAYCLMMYVISLSLSTFLSSTGRLTVGDVFFFNAKSQNVIGIGVNMVSILKQNLGDLGIQSNGVLLSNLTIGYENKCR